MILYWTPICGHYFDYVIQFVATASFSSALLNVQLNVAIPQPQISIAISHLVEGVSVTDYYNSTSNGTQLNTLVGCPLSIILQGRDKDPETRAAGTPFYRQRFSLRIFRSYPHGENNQLPSLDGAALLVVADPNQWNGTTARLDWTPLRGQEGASYTLYFDAVDPCGWAPPVTTYVIVNVAKCQVPVRHRAW